MQRCTARGGSQGSQIIAKEVSAGDLFTEGNSLYEFGWSPGDETLSSLPAAQLSRHADLEDKHNAGTNPRPEETAEAPEDGG